MMLFVPTEVAVFYPRVPTVFMILNSLHREGKHHELQHAE